MSAQVTVVIIVFNDAERLPRAVKSVMAQTMGDLEIVIADDFSTDDSVEVARALAATDPRITVVARETNSGGCGAPRNSGIAASSAPYIMFLDSDDELEPTACAVMLEAITSADADMAAGLTMRITDGTGKRQAWYPELYQEARVLETIDTDPEQLFDGLSTNKIYRRGFLEEIGLVFREDLHYEDILFIYQAYLQAQRIAIIPDQIYIWHRAPKSKDLSISLRRHDMANFRDRLVVHRELDVFFAANASHEVQIVKDKRFVMHDLRIYLQDLTIRNDEYRLAWIDEAAAYVKRLDPEAVQRLSPGLRVALAMIEHHDIVGLMEAIALLYNGGKVLTPFARIDDALVWDPALAPDALPGGALDISDLDLGKTTLGQKQLWTEVDVAIRGTKVHLTGLLANPIKKLKPTIELELVARVSGGRPLTVPLGQHTFEAGRLTWQGSFDLKDVHIPPTTGDRINLTLRAQSGDKVKTIKFAGDRRTVFPAVALPKRGFTAVVAPRVTINRGLLFALEVEARNSYYTVLRVTGRGLRFGKRSARRLMRVAGRGTPNE